MRSIAVVNQKGGVGKTTTAVNVAAAIARGGRRVLLVDCDPQAHASMHLGIELNGQEPSIYDVLCGRRSVLEAVRRLDKNLLVLPSHVDLVAAEIEMAEQPDRHTILAGALRPLLEDVDYCLVDCAPSLGLLAVNALAAVHEVLIPLQPHFLALQGLGKLLETVTLVRDEINPDLRISGILFSMFESGTRLAQEVVGDVRNFVERASPGDAWHGAQVFDTRIRRNIKLAECPSFGKTIFDYAPGSHGAADYESLAAELTSMSSAPIVHAATLASEDVGELPPPAPCDQRAPAAELDVPPQPGDIAAADASEAALS